MLNAPQLPRRHLLRQLSITRPQLGAHNTVQNQRHEADRRMRPDALGQAVVKRSNLDLGLVHPKDPLNVGQRIAALEHLSGLLPGSRVPGHRPRTQSPRQSPPSHGPPICTLFVYICPNSAFFWYRSHSLFCPSHPMDCSRSLVFSALISIVRLLLAGSREFPAASTNSLSDTHTAVKLPSACSLAKLMVSRLSVLMRTPGMRGIKEGATTAHDWPSFVSW
jgi:hypothetical protein